MATVEGPRAGTDEGLRERLVREFAAFGPAYMRWLHSSVGGGPISYPRMRLLGALQCHGRQIMSGLSEELGVTPRNVTALVDALEQEGLVRRRPHPTDRRATYIELTPEGRHACAHTYTGHMEKAAELFAELSEPDQRELLRIMSELRAALHSRGIEGHAPVRAPSLGDDPD